MNRFFFFGLVTSLLLSSCVSSKIYDDVLAERDALKLENEALMSRLDEAGSNNKYTGLESLKAEAEKLRSENTRLSMELEAINGQYNRLKESYDALESNTSASLTENFERNRKLLADLEAKEKRLLAEEERLAIMSKQLAERTKRVDELEAIIAAKDAKMKSLKEAISAALVNFEGKGLTVEQRDGKVYVSMENKLLFESGSWAVNTRGREAVEALGTVLAQNKEISVLIEGHTDNVPYTANGNIENNWDLSTKRATAIVQLLSTNPQLPKENLTAAGRGEFVPVASNSDALGRAKNRRIEVILTPELEELNRLLNEI